MPLAALLNWAVVITVLHIIFLFVILMILGQLYTQAVSTVGPIFPEREFWHLVEADIIGDLPPPVYEDYLSRCL